MFDDDVAPIAVRPVITDPAEWAADMAGRVRAFLAARARAPRDAETSMVEVAGALLAVLPLADAVAAIADSMATPCLPVDEYDPVAGELAGFAGAVNQARRMVYAFTEDCWAARREVLVDWSRRAKVGLDPGEHEAGLEECSIVVAEATVAEQRLAVFERGVRGAISAAEDAISRGDIAAVAGLIAEVEAAGRRHSMPPTVAVDCV